MKLDRRGFFQAAAASTAAVLQDRASASPRVANTAEPRDEAVPDHFEAQIKAFEVDLSDPRARDYWRNPNMCLFARLEEQHPGDPGQLSGVVLNITDTGKYTQLAASIDGKQLHSGRTAHVLGYLESDGLQQIIESVEGREPFTVQLREFYDDSNALHSGATLISFGRFHPEIRLCFGCHCFGVLKGRALAELMGCAAIRCGIETE